MKAYKEFSCRTIVKGYAKGNALLSLKPINLLTIDDKGFINDHTSVLNGSCISDKILIYPNAVGSSVGAYKLYTLKMINKAPKAIVCIKKADIITASAAALANIPLVDNVNSYEEMLNLIKEETLIEVDANKGTIKVYA